MNIDELVILMVGTLRADPTLARLLGVQAADPRVYRYYEPDAVIDADRKAYITIALTADPERTGAVNQPTFTLAIWGGKYEYVEQVYLRVLDLLDFTTRPAEYLTTASGVQVQPVRVGAHDSAQENTKFAGRQLTLRFGASAV